ncbi:alanine--glyoxylate aminotransferase family protein [Oceanobacillus sp. CFH 90083]|uniref:pyridoxal-phosphate-dependent aminotransferase family protein n=1 Tax=Oceanobacillus sp. CFH 90083 TaxID=2592336 RepID=UPI00128C83F2|nr:alanine--glyoxylate aminotransferase family protein [Oceanobacillus sp. CFH 90083]
MLKDQHILRIPGPSPIPPSVGRAMNQTMIGHRGKETKELLERILPKLKSVFGTKQDVFPVAGSGTAGLEMAVSNAAHPGDDVLVIVSGAFGDRFAKICEAFQLKLHRIDVEWGEAVRPEVVQDYLQAHPEIKVVFATYCETSTGVLNPIASLAKAIHASSDALFVVDGVSCLGGVEANMDDWGVDIYVTGSQKAFMLPAGLMFIAASERAWKVIEENPQPRFYLDMRVYRKNLANTATPYTPALSLLFGLEQVLNLLEEEGLENVYERHRLLRDMTRAAFKALDIPLLTTDEDASPTVTAVRPNDFDAEALRAAVKEQFNLTLAGGQQHMKGSIFRIGHMGYCSPADTLQAISLIEIGLVKIGKDIQLGKGVQAAQEIYLQQEEK